MGIHLPSSLYARPMPDKTCAATVCRPNQETGHGVHAVFQALSPLNNPVEGCRYLVWECPFNPRMKVDEIDGTWTRSSQDTEVVPFREQWIECPERIRIRFRMVSAGNIRLSAEAGFQRYRRNAIARFRCNSPCTNLGGAEGSKLRERLVVEVPTRPLDCDWL